jgi:hypothetical protein
MNDKGLIRKFDAGGYVRMRSLDKKYRNDFIIVENKRYKNCTHLIKQRRDDDEIERIF